MQKYKLNQFTRDESSDSIIEDIRRVAALSPDHELTRAVYKKIGRFSLNTVRRRIGLWSKVLVTAKLATPNPTNDKREAIRTAKYKLNQYNKGASNDELLDDLRRIAAASPGSPITADHYDAHGKFSRQMFHHRFGSWNNALTSANLAINRATAFDALEVVEDVKRVAALVGRNTLTRAEYNLHGEFSATSVVRRCGSWFQALAEAGLKPSRTLGVTEEQWFENIARVWDSLGRQPSYSDMSQPPSVYSPEGYAARFGGWRKALEAFIAFVEGDDSAEHSAVPSIPPPNRSPIALPADPAIERGPRKPGWRLKFLVLRRDGAQCGNCLRSRASHPDLNLVLDHKVPWSKGGRTELDNLRVLCDRCNGGKSDLDWDV